MSTRAGAVVWFVVGGLAGLSFLGAAGMGALFVLPVLFATLVLLALRLPGVWMVLVGAGVVGGLLWASLIIDPNAPDDALWPLLVAVALVGCGVLGWRRERRLPAATRSQASPPADR